MSVGGIHSSNGMFTITDASGSTQKVDLGTLMMMIKLDQTSNLDKQLEVQLSEIQERNNLISQLTEFMSLCREMKNNGWADNQCYQLPDGTYTQSHTVTLNGVPKAAHTWAEELGITGWTIQNHDRPTNKDQRNAWEATWDSKINAIKGKIDNLNNDSQMANIKLQNLLEKRNNAFEMTTKIMDTNNQSIQATIRNL